VLINVGTTVLMIINDERESRGGLVPRSQVATPSRTGICEALCVTQNDANATTKFATFELWRRTPLRHVRCSAADRTQSNLAGWSGFNRPRKNNMGSRFDPLHCCGFVLKRVA
jgi:hypothetical protein